MATFPDRTATALLVVDVQNGVVGEAHDRAAVLDNIRSLVQRARAASVPVVWVQHQDEDLERGSDAWQLVPEVGATDDDVRVEKRYGDSFEATDLEEQLAARGVGHLVVTGAQSDACIRSTIHGAFVRGYDVTLVSDAHTTEDLTEWGAPPPDQVIAHTNLYWRFQSAPDRHAQVVPTDDVVLGGVAAS